MPNDHTVVEMATIPKCDLAAAHGDAYADAALPRFGGTWGYVCYACFVNAGASLGLGKGQKLVLREGSSK
jgi:hypothetical protein